MREGMERDWNVAYGLLHHRNVSSGMGRGQDKDIWEGDLEGKRNL